MAEKFANVCAPASCEAEFNYECDKLKQYILDQGSGAQYEKKAAYIDVLREKKQGYFDYTPVMMNGQLATGAPVIAYICAYGHLVTCCCRYCRMSMVSTQGKKENATDVIDADQRHVPCSM